MYLGKQFCRGKCRSGEGGGGAVGTTPIESGRRGSRIKHFYNFKFLIVNIRTVVLQIIEGISLGKILIRILNPKNGFFVSLITSKKGL